jgi:hypothetical protein
MLVWGIRMFTCAGGRPDVYAELDLVRRSTVTSVPLFRFSGGRLSDNPSRQALPEALTGRQPSGVTAP